MERTEQIQNTGKCIDLWDLRPLSVTTGETCLHLIKALGLSRPIRDASLYLLFLFSTALWSNLLATVVSGVWLEGSKLVPSPRTIMWILIICVLFICLLFVYCIFFSLSYLPFRIDLGKADSLASRFMSFFLVCFKPESLQQWSVVATWAGPHQPPPLALLWVPKMMSLCVFLLWYLIMGKNYKEESYAGFTSFRAAQSCNTGRYFVSSVIVFSFLICYHGTPKAYASPG